MYLFHIFSPCICVILYPYICLHETTLIRVTFPYTITFQKIELATWLNFFVSLTRENTRNKRSYNPSFAISRIFMILNKSLTYFLLTKTFLNNRCFSRKTMVLFSFVPLSSWCSVQCSENWIKREKFSFTNISSFLVKMLENIVHLTQYIHTPL